MHVTVLLEELIDQVMTDPKGLYVDATGGAGGHAAYSLEKLDSVGKLFILDCDPIACDLLKERFEKDKRVVVKKARFSSVRQILDDEGISSIDGLWVDLGISSNQLDDPKRGIGFLTEGVLDMRMDPAIVDTAADLVNDLREDDLANLIFNFGEERLSRRLARDIVKARTEKRLETVAELRNIAEKSLGRFYRKQKIHPATRLFQALRLGVNRELEELDCLLGVLPGLLKRGGRAGIISFHSLEDRKVKHVFRDWGQKGFLVKTKRPICPSESEVANNPRSRSAKLRVIERVS